MTGKLVTSTQLQDKSGSDGWAASVTGERRPGDVVLDVYDVISVLGQGGMGRVYKVRHRQWDLDLAMKCPLPQAIAEAGGHDSFLREAETWVGLGTHAHIATCFYVRTLDGSPHIFVELVDGGSLAEWIASGRLYTGAPGSALARILDVAIQMAWGLHYAHEQGIIHQDVKPANVMMTGDGLAKITDFGLARARGLHRLGPVVGTIVGSYGGMTPAYCSPEQARLANLSRVTAPEALPKLDRRTDVWSWAVSVLEMFTGEVTWQTGQFAGFALSSYLEDQGPSERPIPRMPRGVAAILERCLRDDTRARPANLREVASELIGEYLGVVGVEYSREAPEEKLVRADGINNRAVSLIDLGKEEEAEEQLREALRIDPDHPYASFNVGMFRKNSHTYDINWLANLDRVRQSRPGDWRPCHLLALAHIARGDVALASSWIERADQLVAGDDMEAQGALRQARALLPAAAEIEGELILPGHDGEMSCLAITPDSRMAVSGGTDGKIIFWDLVARRRAHCMTHGFERVTAVTISPDGSTATSESSYRLFLDDSYVHEVWSWDLTSPDTAGAPGPASPSTSRSRAIDRPPAPPLRVEAVLAGDPRFRVIVKDGLFLVMDIERASCARAEKLSCVKDTIAVSDDGRLIVHGGPGGALHLRRVTPPRSIPLLIARPERGSDLQRAERRFAQLIAAARAALERDDWATVQARCAEARAVRGRERAQELRQLSQEIARRSRRGALASVLSVDALEEGAIFWESSSSSLGTSEGDFGLMETRTVRGLSSPSRQGAWRRYLERAEGTLLAAAVTLDGRLGVSGEDDGAVRVWDLEEIGCVWQRPAHAGGVSAVVFTVDGRFVVSGGADGALRLWDVSEGKCVRAFEGQGGAIVALGISLDGRIAVSAAIDGVVNIWDLEAGRVVRTLATQEPSLRHVAISADARNVVTTDAGGHHYWNLEWEALHETSQRWDDSARPIVRAFLACRGGSLRGEEAAFGTLLTHLRWAGFGWISAEAVRAELAVEKKRWIAQGGPLTWSEAVRRRGWRARFNWVKRKSEQSVQSQKLKEWAWMVAILLLVPLVLGVLFRFPRLYPVILLLIGLALMFAYTGVQWLIRKVRLRRARRKDR